MNKRIFIAELFGTAVLVLGGVGSAVVAGDAVNGTILYLGIALAFGLTVLTMAYAIGSISGCHINPAITVAMLIQKRIDQKDAITYFAAQIIGAIVGAGIIFVIASGLEGFDASAGMGSNGYGVISPSASGGTEGYNLVATIVFEVVFTAIFAFVVLATTRKSFPVGFGGLAAGLTLTLVHLVGIPVDGTSVNPARSLAPALFAGGDYLSQVWVFILFPLIGGALGAFIWTALGIDEED